MKGPTPAQALRLLPLVGAFFRLVFAWRASKKAVPPRISRPAGIALEKAIATKSSEAARATEPKPQPIRRPFYFREWPELLSAPMAPPRGAVPVVNKRDLPFVEAWNRIGGLLTACALAANVRVDAVLAVWIVESAGRGFAQDASGIARLLLRFEAHRFYRNWGIRHQPEFNQHFDFRRDKKPWTRQKYRIANGGASWRALHVALKKNEPAWASQDREWEAFDLARSLSADDAVLSSSFGGPQILGENYAVLGYGTPTAMFNAFFESERAHVLGFFDFCRHADILDDMAALRWEEFARHYNGSGQVGNYARQLRKAYETARQVLG